MDSLTQIAVGIATAEAVAGKKLKNKSFLVGALLGTLPDLDVWIGKLFSYELELAFHRAFTHSLLGVGLLAPVLAWVLKRFLPELRFLPSVFLVAAVLITHVGIDLFTSWGVQLLYPYPHRFSFKTIFVVDLFYTIPWLICLAILYKHKDWVNRRKWLARGFYISSSYLLLTVLVKLYVVHKVENSIQAQNLAMQNFIVKPTISNILLWNINGQSDAAFYLGDYSLLDRKPIQFTAYPKNRSLADTLLQYKSVQKLAEVCENWYTITPYHKGTYTFNDLRFGVIPTEDGHSQFVFSYQLTYQNADIVVEPLPKTFREGKEAFYKVWERMKGN